MSILLKKLQKATTVFLKHDYNWSKPVYHNANKEKCSNVQNLWILNQIYLGNAKKILYRVQKVKFISEKLFLVQFKTLWHSILHTYISYRYDSQINNKYQIVCGMVLNDQKFWIPNQWECQSVLDWTKNNFSLLNITF